MHSVTEELCFCLLNINPLYFHFIAGQVCSKTHIISNYKGLLPLMKYPMKRKNVYIVFQRPKKYTNNFD